MARLAKSKRDRRIVSSLIAQQTEGVEVQPLCLFEVFFSRYFVTSILHCFFTSLDETPHNRARDTAGTFQLQP